MLSSFSHRSARSRVRKVGGTHSLQNAPSNAICQSLAHTRYLRFVLKVDNDLLGKKANLGGESKSRVSHTSVAVAVTAAVVVVSLFEC